MSFWRKSPNRFVKILEKRKRAVVEAVGQSLSDAADIVKKQTDARVFVPKQISKQDAPGGVGRSLIGRSPVRIRLEKGRNRVNIYLATHYTRARTKGIVQLFARLGLTDQLFRKSLIVRGKRFPFRSNPRLLKWAQRPEKGFQQKRHVVRLTSAKAREDLILGPAVHASERHVVSVWRRAVKRGLIV